MPKLGLRKIQQRAVRIPKEHVDNRKAVLSAVKENGIALKYASERLRDDRRIVLAAVTKAGGMLKYASERLRDDREVVEAALGFSGSSLRHASRRLRDDVELVRFAMDCGSGKALIHASSRVKELLTSRK